MIEHTMGYEFWIIEVCATLGKSLIAPLVISGIILIVLGFIYFVMEVTDDTVPDAIPTVMKISAGIFGISSALFLFIPSSDTLYLMLSESVAKEVESGKISSRAIEILEKRLEEYKGKK